MDPLSVAASAAGLVTLTAQIVNGAHKYYKDVKDADKQARELLAELEALSSNLDRLTVFLASHTNQNLVFNNNSVLITSIKACVAKLTQLERKIKPMDSILHRMKWPVDQKDHREAMVLIKALSQLIQFSLTIDSCQLLSKTSNDVQRVLGQQMEHFQELQKIETQANQIQHSVQEQSQLLKESRDLRIQEAKQEFREEVLQWISKYNPQSKHDSVREPRVDGTGTWLLACDELKSWRDGIEQPNTLWCQGIPGSGKSVLTSLVIDDLKASFVTPHTPLAYIYLDYRDSESQKPAILLGSILKQLLSVVPEIPPPILELYERATQLQSKLQVSEAQQALVDVCSGFQSAYIVIDALDEATDWKDRAILLEIIGKLQAIPQVRLLITSRPSHEDIQSQLSSAPQLVIKAQEADLRTYLSKRIGLSRAARVMNAIFREEVIETILHNAQDMFLLPELQIRAVLDQPTKGHMKMALRALPNDLPAALSKTISRIQSQPEFFSRLGMDALMWISHAKVPITEGNLCTALAIPESMNELDEDFEPSIGTVIESCHGLVVVDEDGGFLRICHLAVQQYLQDRREELFPSAEHRIMSMCLKYLSFEPFRKGPSPTAQHLKMRIRFHRFGAYAACVWPNHGRRLSDDRSITEILDFLNSADIAASAHQLMQYSLGYQQVYHDIPESYSCTPLHYASLVGLVEVVKRLLASDKYDINAVTKMGTTALIKTASRNHAEIVRLLLQHGAKTAPANRYGNALHCAAEAGACDTIPLLIEAGMEINCKRRKIERTPLHCAVDNDFPAAASLLVHRGADMYAEDANDSTPLEYAVESNAIGVARELLRRGYNLHWRERREQKPILHHIGRGVTHLSKPMFDLLIKHGANLEARCVRNGETVLMRAVRSTCLQDVLFLADHGAKTDVLTVKVNKPLLEVAEVVQASLEQEKDMNLPFSRRDLEDGIAITKFLRARNGNADALIDKENIEKGKVKSKESGSSNPMDAGTTPTTTTLAPAAASTSSQNSSVPPPPYPQWDPQLKELVERLEKKLEEDGEETKANAYSRRMQKEWLKYMKMHEAMGTDMQEIVAERDKQKLKLQQLLVERESSN